MLNRLKWIAISYITRPAVLGFVGFGILLVGLTWFSPNPDRLQANYPMAHVTGLTIDSHASLEEVRRSGLQSEVTSLNLTRLWYDEMRIRRAAPNHHGTDLAGPPAAAFFRVVHEFPNLREISYSAFDNLRGLDEVVSVANLEVLSIDAIHEFDLARLQSLKQLRQISLSMFATPTSLASLQELPNLETFIWRSRLCVDDSVLAAMARLPHLRTLVLDFPSSTPALAALTTASFLPLAQSRSLGTLYVGGTLKTDNTELLQLASTALPGRDVRPATVSVRPPAIISLTMFSLFATVIGMQLSSQFRGPASRLAPHFGSSHALFALCLLAVATAFATIRLIGPDANPLPAAIVATAWLTSLVAVSSLSADSLGKPFLPNQQRARRTIGQIMAVLYFVIFALLCVPQWSESLLHGKWPALLVALLMITAALAWLCQLTLSRLVIWSSASAETGRPDWTLFKATRAPTYERGWHAFDRPLELKLSHWREFPPQWNLLNRVARLRVGNPPANRITTMLTMYVLGAVFIYLVFRFVPRLSNRGPLGIDQMRFPLLFGAATLGLGIVLAAARDWRARTLTTNLELLRPTWRRSLLNDMSLAFVLDIIAPVLIYAATSALLLNLHSNYSIAPLAATLSFFAFVATGLAMAIGLGGVMIVIQRQWLASLMIFGICFGLANSLAILSAWSKLSGIKSGAVDPWDLTKLLWIPLVIGLTLTICVRHRWLKLQFGLRN